MKSFSIKLLSILLIVSVLFIFVPIQQAEAAGLIAAAIIVAVLAVDYYTCIINIFWGGCGGGGGPVIATPVVNQGCNFNIPLTFYNPQMEQTYEYYDDACQTRVVDETQKQVAVYRFTLPSSSTALNDWFFNQIKDQVGNGYTDYTNNSYHMSSTDNNLLATLPYSQLCSGNVCQFTDASAPADVYVAYVAKILADYAYVPPSSSDSMIWPFQKAHAQYCPAPYPNKFFNKDGAFSTVFPSSYSGSGNAVLGPYKTGSAAGCFYPLTVTKSGNGSGIVTSNPSGINCGSACQANYQPGASVTLAASPDSGSTFTQWSGACSGTGNCTLTMDAAKNVNADFTIAVPDDFSLTLGGSVACNSAPLSWTASSGATGYRILRGSPRVDISPYQPYTALNFTDTNVSQNSTYQYQIEAYNGAGTKRSNEIKVTTPYCSPALNFSGNPTSIYQGQSTTLTWSSSYATSCAASGAWSGSKAVNGSEVVIPSPPPSVTYTLTCTGSGGSTGPQSVIINITPLALPEWKEIIPR